MSLTRIHLVRGRRPQVICRPTLRTPYTTRVASEVTCDKCMRLITNAPWGANAIRKR